MCTEILNHFPKLLNFQSIHFMIGKDYMDNGLIIASADYLLILTYRLRVYSLVEIVNCC